LNLKFLDVAPGWKTLVGVIGLALVFFFGGEVAPEQQTALTWFFGLLSSFGLGAKSGRGEKASGTAALLLTVCLLSGCAGLQPAGTSPSTAGAPATAGQIAQTVAGQQGQAPSTATGGTGVINNHFASNVSSDVVDKLIALATDQKWTADQTIAALKATSGAPDSVVLGDMQTSGGDASSIPAGTGGGFGQSGSGTVTKP
jgi:hypothetical protein